MTESQFQAIMARFDYVVSRLDRIEYKQRLTLQGEIVMSQALDDLKAAVAAETTVEQSGIVLMNGIGKQLADVTAQLAAAGADVTALTALKDQVNANAAAMAAAIATNTPAAPTTAPAPVAPDAVPTTT